MNRSARTAETVSDVYLALMLSAFLLWTGPDGYTKILEAKYRLFLLLTIVYCAAAALSALRQIRTVCFCKLLRAVRPAEWLMLGSCCAACSRRSFHRGALTRGLVFHGARDF